MNTGERFLIHILALPGMVVNPLIIKGIDSLGVSDSIKQILYDIIDVEDRISVGSDHHSAIMSIKKILEKHAGKNKEADIRGENS